MSGFSKSIQKSYLRRLGRELRLHRLAIGLSQAQLAIDANMEVSQISRIERGVINTSVGTLLQISAVLEVDISELLPPSFSKEKN